MGVAIAGFFTLILFTSFHDYMEIGSIIALTTGGFLFLILYGAKESIEENNTIRVINWAKEHYGITINKSQATELVRYGNAEFGSSEHMIQLCLVERNGKFSLHRTRELDILKEKE
jgi:hypothetical protein